MPEMITVRCPRCGKKLLFSPFDNYKKATLECPGCHYTGLVETYPEITEASQSHSSPSQGGRNADNRTSSSAAEGASVGSSPTNNTLRQRNPKGKNNTGIRDLDQAPSKSRFSFHKGSGSNEPKQHYQTSQQQEQPSGFAVKFPWVISGLALAIILLYVCLQCISTNEVI